MFDRLTCGEPGPVVVVRFAVVVVVDRDSNFLGSLFGMGLRDRLDAIDYGCSSCFARSRGCIHLVLSDLVSHSRDGENGRWDDPPPP